MIQAAFHKKTLLFLVLLTCLLHFLFLPYLCKPHFRLFFTKKPFYFYFLMSEIGSDYGLLKAADSSAFNWGLNE